MTDAPTPTPWNRTDAWKWARRGLLVAFVGAGVFLWRGMEPMELAVAFDVDPTFAGEDGAPIRRDELRRVHGRVIDKDGAELVTLSVELPDGLHGPSTPTVALRLPRGRYALDMRLVAEGGREARRAVTLTVAEEGFRRVELGR
ncbi:MAG: hypothetical protein R3F39_21795 [Myxococcota bacterium]